ncbi:MAG: hypothetical protein KDK65_00455 [Chlamydiia bacterium]|nr:hypothetical protein [Chlamydiia bacterium]
MTINPVGRIDAEYKAVAYDELVKIEGSSGFRKFCYLVKNWGQGKGFLTEEKRQKVYDNIKENMDTNTYSQFVNAQNNIMSEGVIKAVEKMGNIQVTPPEQATPDKPGKELNILAFNRLLSDPNFPTLMNKIAAQILPEVEVGPIIPFPLRWTIGQAFAPNSSKRSVRIPNK